MKKFRHFMYVPWTGLGLYGGFRGNRWLKNRIKVFKQFVIPSLLAQTNKDFTLWCSWRPEEKFNRNVLDLIDYLSLITDFKSVHTFNGICFYDDKYEDDVAKDRLATALHRTMAELINFVGDVDDVLMTIQPSDDLYNKFAVAGIQAVFQQTDYDGFGFSRGYMMNYQTQEVAEYNPTTNPPFYTIRFSKEDFIDPYKHMMHTAIKKDMGKYKAGTPCPSHEYIGGAVKYGTVDDRGFLVGCHGENISTVYNHPFRGFEIKDSEKEKVLEKFGIDGIGALKIRYSWRKWLLRKLSHRAQRKIRYLFGEKFWQKIYEFFRN